MAVDLNIKVGGQAGQGLQVIGYILAKILSRGGFHVFVIQDYLSRVRGGHNFFQLRVSEKPAGAMNDKVNMLIALDEETINAHQNEVVEGGAILYDGEEMGVKLPEEISFSIPINRLAVEIGGKPLYANSVAIGAALGLLGYVFDPLVTMLEETFERKGADIVENNVNSAKAGYEHAQKNYEGCCGYSLKPTSNEKRMLISGNEALGLGAIAAGLKFFSAYPMTPSTGIFNYVASNADKFNMVVEQAEDEISAMNMAIGASFAGVRAMTVTSGGGFSLMVEALGLAGMTETPVVAVEAQRPGPATGLPTRTEQGDLEFVLHAAQGEFPRCVFAPKNARDAFYLTIKAFNIAEKYQLPVIILSDQYLADSIQTFKKFDLSGIKIERGILTDGELRKIKDYKRHLFTESGISPRAYPSQVDTVVVTDSDEHAEDGHLTEGLEIRVKMTEKRLKKLEGLKEEIAEPEIYGNRDAKTMLIGWGSTHGVIREVVDILTNRGKSVNMMQFSEIWPFLAEYVSKILDKPEKSFVIENNATGQLARVIRTETGRMVSGKILKYDGRPFTPEYIIRELEVQGGI